MGKQAGESKGCEPKCRQTLSCFLSSASPLLPSLYSFLVVLSLRRYATTPQLSRHPVLCPPTNHEDISFDDDDDVMMIHHVMTVMTMMT